MYYSIKSGGWQRIAEPTGQEEGLLGIFPYEKMLACGKKWGISAEILEEARRFSYARYDSFENFDCVSLEMLDFENILLSIGSVILYLEKGKAFFFTSKMDIVTALLEECLEGLGERVTLNRVIYSFFELQTKKDDIIFDSIEKEIMDLEQALIATGKRDCVSEIISLRKRLMVLKKYYEQFLNVLDILVEKLEYLLAHEAEEEDPDRDMEQIFVRILSDRTADYMQVSRELSELGWSGNHEYMCLILQITYLNQQNLSTKAICRYVKKKVPDSVSFLYQDEIVVFFNLTKSGMNQEEIASKLIYFIRDTYLKAGYSRVMEGHMNLRRQYVQAKTALDVGSRKKPYLWIHYFSQVALTYILEQATRRLPGTMICHEGLLELKKHDKENQTQYMETLRVYLEQHLSATQAARELFIHRSTFLYRLDRIKEILQLELDDPEEIFYLELSFRLLEQEQEKE